MHSGETSYHIHLLKTVLLVSENLLNMIKPVTNYRMPRIFLSDFLDSGKALTKCRYLQSDALMINIAHFFC